MSNKVPLVYAVVLNWNKPHETSLCLASVLTQDYRNLRVLLVENGSQQELSDVPPECTVIKNKANLGFAGGMNVGLQHALSEGADYVWLLNNDAIVLPGAVQALIEYAESNPKAGLLSPVLLNSRNLEDVSFCGGLWEQNGCVQRTTTCYREYAHWEEAAPDRIWLVGAAILIRRELASKIGGLDEDFFAYWEDNDYCLRSNLAGFHNTIVRNAFVQHDFGTSAAMPTARPPHYFYFMARNELLFLRKHGGLLRNSRPAYWFMRRQLRLLAELAGQPDMADALIQGLRDGILGIRGNFRRGRPLIHLRPWLVAAARRMA